MHSARYSDGGFSLFDFGVIVSKLETELDRLVSCQNPMFHLLLFDIGVRVLRLAIQLDLQTLSPITPKMLCPLFDNGTVLPKVR